MTLPAELKARIVEEARAQPAPTRRRARREAAILVAIAFAASFLVFMAVGGFAHGEGRPLWFTVATVAAWTLAAAWATWGAYAGNAAFGRTRRALVGIAVATPLLLVIFQLQWDWTCPIVTEPIPGKIGFKCLGLGTAIGAVLLAALAYARRASDPVHPVAGGAALGAMAGAWAGVFVDFWCPAANPSHVLIGHIAPVVLLIGVGTVLGHFVISMRSPRRRPRGAQK